ncbi:hypothetical protein CSE15_16505 [Bacillus altitudinis]|uniref:hypothetical protein n=1 Tax=Bacillus altitudinis TaxID=293387 RepID=UPI000C15124D|nr:hypothetical protein [Bacillus altitudinis]ATP95447.1 hypothetical protein CSE15_16505 [Bacillus altitudinis]
MTQYKTEKRKARVGERILITNAMLTGGYYEKGDVFKVTGLGEVTVKVGVPRGILHHEYEVIVGEHTPAPNLFEMDYDELIALVEDAMKVLRTRSYKNGYDQGRFDAEIEAVHGTYEKSDQQKRDGVVDKAKEDVKDRTCDDFAVYTYDFIVNAEKRTVVALRKLFENGRVISKGIAKCAPDDCFNAHIGKAIALRRALGLEVPSEYLNVPQPTDVRVGDVVNYRNAYVLEVVDDSHIPGAKPVSTIRISALQGSGGGYVIIDDSRAGDGE